MPTVDSLAVLAPTVSTTIRQHNVITQARYDYTSCQLDIFFYLLSLLKRDDPPDQEYKLYVKDIEFLSKRTWNYQQLREATADMGSRMFEIETDKAYKQLWTFQSVEYVKGKGYLSIKLALPIRSYLFNLKDNFTSYQLHSALKLSSKYAKRIYQLASQWKDKAATRTYTLDEFKEMLHIKDPKGKTKESFENISQLKARVLDIAVRQVNEHTDLRIDYKLGKRGRAYDTVHFTIESQLLPELPIPFKQAPNDPQLTIARAHLDHLGITDPQLVGQILNDPAHVSSLFKFIYELKTGKVKAETNPGGLFLRKCGLR